MLQVRSRNTIHDQITEGVAPPRTESLEMGLPRPRRFGEYIGAKPLTAWLLRSARAKRVATVHEPRCAQEKCHHSALEGVVGIENSGQPERKQTRLEVFPAPGIPTVIVSCQRVRPEVALRGAVILPGRPQMLLTLDTEIRGTNGTQKPERFVGGANAVLEASFTKGGLRTDPR